MLPSEWIDRLFARLAVRYGASWMRKWDGLDIQAVRADWAEVLSGFRADDLDYGLKNLPADQVPTAAVFREICRRAPPPLLKALPAPKSDPVAARKVRQVIAKIRPPADPKGWAHDLKAREEAGECLSMIQRQFWREALRQA